MGEIGRERYEKEREKEIRKTGIDKQRERRLGEIETWRKRDTEKRKR